MSDSELPPYDCAAHPSTVLDPKRVSPLDSNRLYSLSVYDEEKVSVDDDEPCFDAYESSGWVTVGLARFCAKDHSFHLADHRIPTAYWNDALHALSWSDAHEGTARVPLGSLHFSEDLASFQGIVMASDGRKRTISGLIIAGYHTQRAREGKEAFDSYDFFLGAVISGEPRRGRSLCQIWNPDNYDDDEAENGFLYDISPDARFIDPEGVHYVKRPGIGESGYLSFDIIFAGLRKEFKGTFSEDDQATKFTWTGKSFDIPDNITKLIEDHLKKGKKIAPPPTISDTLEGISHKAQAAPSSDSVDIYLPAAAPEVPPPYSAGVFLARTASAPILDELKLWQISSYKSVLDPDGKTIIKDIVQEYVGKSANDFFMNSLPDSVKTKFNLHDAFLEEELKTIKTKNAVLNDEASIPFFAEALLGSPVVTEDEKKQIFEDKVKAWFNAMSSLDPPKTGKDPVVEAGLVRGSEKLKKLQDAYAAQMDELYRYYYKIKVGDFHQYSLDQSTAKEWFGKFKAYVESKEFLAAWASRNADIDYKNGSREIMEASVKFNILEDVGYPDRKPDDRQTPEILKTLAGHAAMAQASSSVKFDPELEKKLEELINSVGTATQDEISKKYPELIEEFKQLQMFMLAFGSVKDFSSWLFKVTQHYGAGGKEGFVRVIQMAGNQMKNIWGKIVKGVSRDKIIAEFGEAVTELAEAPLKDPSTKDKIMKVVGKINGGIKTILGHLALIGAAAALIAVAAGSWGVVDVAMQVYLGLQAFAYAMKGLKLFASTLLGKFIKTRLLDGKQFLKNVGDWFSKEGIPKDIKPGSFLSKIFGKSVSSFLKRLGAVLAVAMVVVCAFDFKKALASGDPMEITESAIYLVLAIIDVAVVFTGIVANLVGASAVAACAGPIGLAIAAIGFVVAIVFFLLKIFDPKPIPNPVQDFINGELNDKGFKKKDQ